MTQRNDDVEIVVSYEQMEAIREWRALHFDRTADTWLTDVGLSIEAIYAFNADFLDGCVARGELDRPTADRVKALFSKGCDEAKRQLQERISEARATLFRRGDEPGGEQ